MTDVLIIGSRGREHAMAEALRKDERVGNLFCIPGNGGLAGIATCINIPVTDTQAILEFLDSNPSIKLTVVDPDESLAMGLVDLLTEKGHRAFGPSKKASIMESSKSYCRELCRQYNIPAPKYEVFDDYAKAKRYVQRHEYPLVVKTEGRTAGKGIIFCRNNREAENSLYDVMIAELFGEAGKKVDVEEFLVGKNVTVMAFCDGKTIVPMPAAVSYKRVYDDDMGMSTAGMGAFTPYPEYNDEIASDAYDNIFLPTMNALNVEGREFRGVIAFSLILTDAGAKAVDFTVRFCDVESQVVIPMLKTPLLDVFNAIIDQKLDSLKIEWNDTKAACVVLTSGGYPLEYNKNLKITIDPVDEGVTLYHAGTKLVDGELRTSGGRVISVSATGDSLYECRRLVYSNIQKINFDGMHYRKDIAKE